MHFMDTEGKKFVPFHCMEELVAGNQRLLKKMFFALYR